MKYWLLSLAVLGCGTFFSSTASAMGCNDGENRRVKIINETDTAMQRFYASPTGVTDWEEDILGDDVIKPYGSMMINFDDGRCLCVYDFKAVYSGRQDTIRYKVNVCEITSYRYH